jgi:5'-nucleotidase
MNIFSTNPPVRPAFTAQHSATARRGLTGLALGLGLGLAAAAPLAFAHEDGELLERRIGSATIGWATAAGATLPVRVRILSFNDLHGQLETHQRITGSDGSRPVGGAAVLASYLAAERSEDPDHTLTLIAGDSVGASALVSGLLHDEPTVAVLNGLAGSGCPRLAPPSSDEPLVTRCRTLSTVGNHEFDHGVAELERQLYGGAHADGVGIDRHWAGSHVPELASNVRRRDGAPFLPPAAIVTIDGIRIGVVGAVTAETPSLVPSEGIASVTFEDEAPRINAAVRALRERGVATIVLLTHEGLLAPRNPVPAPLGPGEARGRLASVLAALDGGIDVVVAGHTHQPNNVLVPLRSGPPALVVQARSYGTAYAAIDLKIDRKTGAVVAKSARVMTTWADEGPGRSPDFRTARIVAAAARATAAVRERRVAVAAAAIRRGNQTDPETALGDLVADALRATAATDFAFTNPGGLRNDLEAGSVTHGALYDVLPFGNRLVRMTMTGSDVLAVLEQQFEGTRVSLPSYLRVSGLRYVYDLSRPAGARILAVDDATGRALDPARRYTVVTTDYLLGGGDHYTTFAAGAEATPLVTDIEAVEAALERAPGPLAPRTDGRVRPFATAR